MYKYYGKEPTGIMRNLCPNDDGYCGIPHSRRPTDLAAKKVT